MTEASLNVLAHTQSEELRLHREVLANMAQGLYLVRLDDATIVYANPKLEKMFGYNPGEMNGRPVSIVNAPSNKSPEEKAEEILAVLHKNGEWHGEVKNIRKDGTFFWCEADVSIFDHSEQGKICISLHTDITARKDTEQELRESTQRYKSLVENTDDLITRVDCQGLLLYVNSSSMKYWGLPAEDCLGKPAFDFIYPDDREYTKNHFHAWLNAENNFITFENRQLHASGTTTRMQWMVTAVRDDNGRLLEFNSIARDISEYNKAKEELQAKEKSLREQNEKLVAAEMALRVQIEGYETSQKRLKESEERFRLIFETNPDPLILANLADGAIIDVNKAFEAATGIPRLVTLGHNSEELGLWVDKDLREPFREQLRQHGEVYNFEAKFRVMGNQVRTCLLSARLLMLDNKACILIVIRDITTEKAAEGALIEMDRMKSEFISAAAHELSTPLSAMMGFTELLLDPEQFGGFTEEQKQDFLTEVYDRGEALSSIIDDLLDISRIESGQPVTLDLKEADLDKVLLKAVEFYRGKNPGRFFKLVLQDKAKGALLLIDRHRITQVLENLLSNAVKYSPEDSVIIVEGRPGANGWEIRVADSGIGMTPEQVDRIFDKFYRADSSDTAISGLGLGMSIVRQIVTAHGGMISVESKLGRGTEVCFSLPA